MQGRPPINRANVLGLQLKSLFSRSIKTRVTLFTLTIFVLSLWALSFYASSMLRQDMQRLVGEQQFSTVSLIADEIDHELSDRKLALEQIAGRIDARLMLTPSDLQALLTQQTILQSMFNGGLFVTDTQATAIADVPLSAGRIGTNYLDRDSVSVPLREGKTVIGRPAPGKKLGAPIFSIVAPIRDAKRQIIGALVGTFNLGLPNFLDRITQGKFGPSAGFLLISPNDRMIVTASDKRRIMETIPAAGQSPVMDRMMDNFESTGIFVNALGSEVMNSSRTIPIAGWRAVVTVPVAVAFAPVHHQQKRLLMATVLLTVLAGGLTWWMLRRQLAPLHSTARELSEIVQANRSSPVLPVTRLDEIGELVGSFNQLLQTLNEHEAKLRQSEAFKSGILNAMTSHIAVLDHKGVIVAVNSGWSRFALDNSQQPGQATPHTGVGVNYLDMCHGPGDAVEGVAQQARAGILQVLQGRVPSFSLDYPCHSPSEQRWYTLVATPIGPADDVNVVITHTNITERKLDQLQLARYSGHLENMVAQQTRSLEQSNAALRDSQARLKTTAELLEQTGAVAKVGGWEIDLNSMRVTWSEQVFRIFEREPSGPLTLEQASRNFVPDSQAKVRAAVARAQEGGTHRERWDVELQAVTDQGHLRWIHTLGQVEQTDGKVVRVFGSVHDVTESVLGRHAIEANQLSLQVCFDNQQTGVAVFSETALLYCNPAFRSLLGYAATQPMDHVSMGSLVPSTDQNYLSARHKRAKTYSETLPPKLLKLNGNGGVVVTCLVSGSIVPWNGEPQFLASVTAIGDLARVEQEIRASEDRYERLLVTQLEEQQAHIARELHDSMGSRLAGVVMLLGGIVQKHPELAADIQMALEQIQIAAQSSRAMAHSLVPVAALPGAFWRSLERLCLDYAKLAGVQCLFFMDGDFEEVDAETGNHLFRIAQEALVNAVKHGHASKIVVGLEEREDCLAMTVVDNGGQVLPQPGEGHSSRGIGLKSMQARAKIIDGAFKWYVNSEGGVTVSIVWGLESV